MEKVFKISKEEIDNKKRNYLIIFFILLAISIICLTLCCIFQNRGNVWITILLVVIGSALPLFIALYFIVYKRNNIKNYAKLQYFAANRKDFQLFTLNKIDNKVYIQNYLPYQNLYFIGEDNQTIRFQILQDEADNFSVGSKYKIINHGDVILQYEKQ